MSGFITIDHFSDPGQQQILQLELLYKQLDYLKKNSRYYSELIPAIDSLKNMQSLGTVLKEVPFTTKDNIASHNLDFYCCNKEKIVDFATTSGTTGSPVSFALSGKDVERLAINEMTSFQLMQLTASDTIQLMTTMDKQFMAGLAYYQGALKLGSTIIRIGPGAALQQWDAILKYKPSTLICVPSFIPILLDYAIQNDIDYKSSSVEKILCIGEPIRNSDFSLNPLGKKIVTIWDVELYSTYASTEMAMAFTECTAHSGGHLIPELGIVEVIDENGNHVESGESGEVVVTNLQNEGTPLLRFKTGDICHFYNEPCSCGRKTPRLGPVIGRKQQMLKFKGTTIFPPAIFEVIDHFENISLYQIVITTNEYKNNEIELLLSEKEISENQLKKIKEHFKIKIKVTPKITMLDHRILNDRVYNENERKHKKILYL